MAVFRIERTRDYTVMSNHHLRNAIKVLNTINFKKSMHYNPFAYARHEVA